MDGRQQRHCLGPGPYEYLEQSHLCYMAERPWGGTIGTAFYAVGGDGDSGPTNDTQQYAVGACFTPTPTPVITATPTATGISNCTTLVAHAFSTCATPDSYNYGFELQSTCPLAHHLDIYLEAAPDVGGPWDQARRAERWVNPTYPFVVTGTFIVNIPEQYGCTASCWRARYCSAHLVAN